MGAPRLFAVPVDVRIGEDPVQPGLEVGSDLEGVVPAERLEQGLLEHILGVGGITRHAQRSRIQLRRVLHDIVLECGRVGHEPPVAGWSRSGDLNPGPAHYE